jgi:hypothetical protein
MCGCDLLAIVLERVLLAKSGEVRYILWQDVYSWTARRFHDFPCRSLGLAAKGRTTIELPSVRFLLWALRLRTARSLADFFRTQ